MAQVGKIRLEGMVFFGRHGARREEKSLGQQLEVDLEIEADLSSPRTTDNLTDTIDYGQVYAVVKAVIEGPSRNLLERLAGEIASRILAGFPVMAARVTVRKPRVPLGGGILDGVSVEVYQAKK